MEKPNTDKIDDEENEEKLDQELRLKQKKLDIYRTRLEILKTKKLIKDLQNEL